MFKKYFNKIVDAIFGKRCGCVNTKPYTPEVKTFVKCITCGKVQ